MALRCPASDTAWFAGASVSATQALCVLKRPHDMLSWLAADTLALLLPHTGVREAQRERDRLQRQLGGIAGGWTLSTMVYPADAAAIERLPLDEDATH